LAVFSQLLSLKEGTKNKKKKKGVIENGK